jgi:hypothetical protein
MLTRVYSLAAGGCALLLAVAGSSTMASAQSLPDLVIQTSDSEVVFKSCDQASALAEGRIVIRNEGNGDANLRSADDFFRSFVAVYQPENIDLIAKDTKRTKVEPGEQRAIQFSLGAGAVKKGRNYNANPGVTGPAAGGYPTEAEWFKNTAKYKDQIVQLQKFLISRGYFLGKTGPAKDGADGKWGGASTNALKNFQGVVGLAQTGTWNDDTARKVVELSGNTTKPVFQNVKDGQGRTRINLYAVVDPYNLIDESNETNNIVTYTGYLACDK